MQSSTRKSCFWRGVVQVYGDWMKNSEKRLKKISKSALIPEYELKKIPKLCPHTDKKTWSCTLSGLSCPQVDRSNPQYICGGLDRSVKDKGEDVIKKKIKRIQKWNKAVKKAGIKKLENLKFWKAFQEQFNIVSDFDVEGMIRDELEFLLKCGFEVGFNHDQGVGYILPDGKDKYGHKLYKIQLWQFYKESYPLKKASLRESLRTLPLPAKGPRPICSSSTRPGRRRKFCTMTLPAILKLFWRRNTPRRPGWPMRI